MGNSIPSQLYNYFLTKLDAKIAAYGKERMERDVQALRSLNHELLKQCVIKYRILPEVKLQVGVEVMTKFFWRKRSINNLHSLPYVGRLRAVR